MTPSSRTDRALYYYYKCMNSDRALYYEYNDREHGRFRVWMEDNGFEDSFNVTSRVPKSLLFIYLFY